MYFALHVIIRRQVRWISTSDCSVCLTSSCHQQSPVQSWLERAGRNVCEGGSPLPTPPSTPSTALIEAGDSRSGADGSEASSLGQLEQCALSRGQESDVARAWQLEGNVLSCFELTKFHQTISGLHQWVCNEQGSLGITFCWDDGCLLLLLCLREQKSNLGTSPPPQLQRQHACLVSR